MTETETATPHEVNLFSQYFLNLRDLLTRPTHFFRTLPRPVGFVGPLFFGIITSWFGSTLEFLWYSGFHQVFGSRLSDLMSVFDKVPQIDSSGRFETALALREKIANWVFGVGGVLIDPFKTCASILFLSTVIWIAARLFADRDYPREEKRLDYATAVSIVGFAQAASVFKIVPVLGGTIAALFAMVLSVIGVTETYRVTTGRAIVIALFPTILFWGLIFASVLAFFSAILMLFMH